MKISKRIVWLREQVAKQKKWIKNCGGDLAGYIANYGDPGVPPLVNGEPKKITVPAKDRHLFAGYEPVPGTTSQFFARHSGDGGTAIYKADTDALHVMQTELAKLEANYRKIKDRPIFIAHGDSDSDETPEPTKRTLSFDVLCDNKSSYPICVVGGTNFKPEYGKPVLLVRCNREDMVDNERGHKLASLIAGFLNQADEDELRYLLTKDMLP